jgi:hypothetical protein
VNIYSTPADDPQPFTSWEAGVDAGQQWQESRLASGVVVKVTHASRLHGRSWENVGHMGRSFTQTTEVCLAPMSHECWDAEVGLDC